DAISARHARKAAEAGVDGIIAVAAGAGGHSGNLSPFALVSEIRTFFDGTLVLAGAINTGRDVAAARMMGADMAYLGTRFIATQEATASDGYKQMLIDSSAADVVYTPRISGVNANFLRPSLIAEGLDPDNLPEPGGLDVRAEARVWRDLWSAGQGVGAITDAPPARVLCDRLVREYSDALAQSRNWA
ncbi:MAG: nitronate monooxygenase, partial [Gemmobacter sp.]|nr:nitronate monooxygenase [Gemmobacter sp.]